MPFVKPSIGSSGWGSVLNSTLDYLYERLNGIILTDLGTTDGQTAALIDTPGSLTGDALSATFAAKVLDATTAVNQNQELFRIVPFSDASGDFRAFQRSIANSDATVNHVTYMGWNVGSTHSREVSGKPAIAMGFESNFYDVSGDGNHGPEWYVESIKGDGTFGLSRPFYARGSWETGENEWIVHIDIGTTAGGHFDVYAGKANPVKFTVSSTSAQFTVPLNVSGNAIAVSPNSGQAVMFVNTNAGPGPVIQLAIAGTPRWNLYAEGVSTFGIYDQDSRYHMKFTYNTDDQAARSDFYSRLVGSSDIETTRVGSGFILKSPDGTRYRIKVANGGALSTEAA